LTRTSEKARNRVTRFNTPEQVTEVIENFITDFEYSVKRKRMKLGTDYYRSRNTEIMNRRKLVYAEDSNGEPKAMDDPYSANNKLPSGYFKILVDQKVNYLLGNEITFDTEDEEELEDTLPQGYHKKIKKAAKETSKKARAWIQPYINSDGEFELKHIPSEQVIPVYKPHNPDELELVIRYYQVKTMNEDDEAVEVNRVEVWDDETVAYYQENHKTGLYHLIDEERLQQLFGEPYSNPKYHFERDIKFGDRLAEREGLAWGKVPFVPLYNNDEEDYDLQPVKRFIDAYDIVNSDFINNLEDFQDVYWVLKGYNGQNLTEFLRKVKAFRGFKTSHDGEARAETIDIPDQARKEALRQLEQDIFNFGMGVNPNQLGDGNITNVVIKSRYANLDLKCDQFEDEVKEFIFKLMYFVNRYREINGQEEIELDDVEFDRAMMVNETELAELANESRGHISERTRLSNDPRVSDVEREIERMEEDMEDMVDLDDVELEEEEDEEEPEGEE